MWKRFLGCAGLLGQSVDVPQFRMIVVRYLCFPTGGHLASFLEVVVVRYSELVPDPEIVSCCAGEVQVVGEFIPHSAVGKVSEVSMEGFQVGLSPSRKVFGETVWRPFGGCDGNVHVIQIQWILEILSLFLAIFYGLCSFCGEQGQMLGQVLATRFARLPCRRTSKLIEEIIQILLDGFSVPYLLA